MNLRFIIPSHIKVDDICIIDGKFCQYKFKVDNYYHYHVIGTYPPQWFTTWENQPVLLVEGFNLINFTKNDNDENEAF